MAPSKTTNVDALLIDHAVEQNIIQPVLRTQIDSWIRLRNELCIRRLQLEKLRPEK